MTRPTVEVADLLRTHGDRFVAENRSWLSYQQLKVLRAIQRCRTPALGGHLDHCSGCGHSVISFNSCRNRHCPKCQAQARQRWLACREQELLGLSYFHVVFTLPHELNRLCQRNPALLYNLLFRSVSETLLEVAADPKHLGAEIGFLAILHTLGTEPASPSTSPLSRAGRRPFSRPPSLGTTPVSFLSPSRCSEESLPRQVSRGTQACLSQEQAQSRRCDRAIERSQSLPGSSSISASEKLGRLCQTSHGGPKTCASLSGPLYPSRCHQQSPARFFRWGTSHFPLEGLCTRQQTTPDDTLGIGVLAALRATCASARLRAHSPVWIPCQPAPFKKHCCDSPSACFEPQPQTAHVTASGEAQWRCPRCGNSMQISHRLTARELYLSCQRLDTLKAVDHNRLNPVPARAAAVVCLGPSIRLLALLNRRFAVFSKR